MGIYRLLTSTLIFDNLKVACSRRSSKMSKKNFLFSIVMPAYGVEKWIAEAIESVINQDIGFEENVQLIIVDDGSKDNSGKIADSYAEKYPVNITVIHKENGGLSSARNAGVKIAEGKLLSFLDSDDTFDTNVLSTVWKFFENDTTGVKMATIPVIYFENREGDHLLNYKFENGTRVINLLEDFDYPQHFINSVFIYADFAKENAFDEDLHMSVSEDAREITKLLIKDPRYAVITGTKYNYRWRSTSIMNTTKNTHGWFFTHLNEFIDFFVNKYKDEPMPKFVQYSLMYNLQWRVLIKEKETTVLSKEEYKEWKDRCLKVITSFDDDVIIKQRTIKIEQKAYLLYKKYNKYPKLIKTDEGTIGYTFDDSYILKSPSTFKMHLNFFKVTDDELKICGWFSHNLYLSKAPVKPYVLVNGKKVYAEMKQPINGKKSFKDLINQKIPVEFNVKLSEETKLEFHYQTRLGSTTSKIIIDVPYPVKGNDGLEAFTKDCYRFKKSKASIKVKKIQSQ